MDSFLQVDKLDMLIDHIDKANHKRTCSYLTSFARYLILHQVHIALIFGREFLLGISSSLNGFQRSGIGCLYSYVPEPEDMAVLKIAYQLYCKFNKFPEALRVALRMGNIQVYYQVSIFDFWFVKAGEY